jgi:alkylation response protein AidB-like acyl-CoA dehydrogenase
MLGAMSARVVLETMERWVDPPAADERERLLALDAHLARILPEGRGAELEARGEFPDAELRAFAREGFIRDLVPGDQGGSLDWARAMRIALHFAAHDLDVTLCIGGTVLGGMPVLVAGDAAHRAQYFAPLLRGEMGGFGLSEWAHGSDLLAIAAVAEPLDARGAPCAMADAARFRLNGTKSPVNNGTRGANVVVLVRTGESGDPFGYSLFLVPRETPGVLPGPKYAPLGFRCMDLSGITLDRAELPKGALLGKAGEGFVHARRALEVSRSGVATMAVGPQATCLALALAHARDRHLYGAPIGALGGVQAIVARVFARFAEALAIARRAVRAAARFPESARAFTAAAKFVCPTLLEETVHDVGTLLGARSLMEDLPFARLRRSAPLLAIFDGSSQLQLDELWRYAARWRGEGALTASDAVSLGARLRDPAPVPFVAAVEDTQGELDRAAPSEVLGALDAVIPGAGLAILARAGTDIAEVARGARKLSQAARFRVSGAAATLHGLAALAEAAALADADDARTGLRAALAIRTIDAAPRLAAALATLGPAIGKDFAGDAARVLSLAREDDETREAAWAAARALLGT